METEKELVRIYNIWHSRAVKLADHASKNKLSRKKLVQSVRLYDELRGRLAVVTLAIFTVKSK